MKSVAVPAQINGDVSHGRGAAARPGTFFRSGERASVALPAEIGFLAAYGLAPGLLLACAQQARLLGISAESVLLGEGLMQEADYYKALARHCKIAYLDRDVRLGGASHYPQAVHAGVADIAGFHQARWLLAPRGTAIARVIQAARAAHAPAFAITAPAQMSALLQRQHRREILARASFDLPNSHPQFSAFQKGAMLPSVRVAAMLLVAVLALVVSGWFWLAVTFACGLVFLSGIFLRLSAAAMSDSAKAEIAPELPEALLPTYTIVVPLYDEASIVAQLAGALDALDYPKARLDIKIVVEERDQSTLAALTALALPARYEIIVAPEGRPRTKPRALNIALPLARGTLLSVFDAEDVPEPRQLRLAAARFAQAPETLACVQARLAIENIGESWLTRLFAVEYAALFDVINPGLAVLGLPLPLGGTSNHFRTSVLRQIKGWDAWNVTEDADLGLRLARWGYGVETINATTLEEAPVALQAWLGQRRRWQKGWMQTIATHLHNPARLVADLGFARAAFTAAMMLGMVMGPLVGPFFTVLMLYEAVCGDMMQPQTAFEICASSLACFVFVAGVWAMLWPAVLGIRHRRLWPLLPWLALLPAYYLLGSIAAWQGLFEFCTKPFHWQKTAHGVTKTARGRAATPVPPPAAA